MLRLCLSTGGLCCFVLLHLDQGPSHRLGRPRSPSVCHVLLCCKTLAVNRLCFLSFITSLNISHRLYLYLCSSLLPSASFPPLSFHLHLAPPRTHLCHLTPSLFPPGLCCAVAVHRSDQDRWSQMISGLFSFLQETAWYCCWHVALLGCLQVQDYQNSIQCRSLSGRVLTLFWFESFLVTLD